MTFHVGQKVVCVSGPILKMAGWVIQPHIGAIYTIRDIYISHTDNSHFAVRLVEITNGLFKKTGREYGFFAVRFRPIVEHKTDISIFTAMLNPTKRSVDA